MASPPSNSSDAVPSGPKHSAREPINAVTTAMGDLALQNSDETMPPAQRKPPRPPYTYTRAHALLLHKSPLVQVPEGMPALKDWFGDWSEQHLANKKDSENTTSTNGNRERRFRREADDPDAPARPTFRSALSQPSQMGNFKHQPIRGDRDRDLTRERERDTRDKEGQERLRSVSGQLDQNSDVLNLRQLSDKYDRERLSLGSASALRAKERELAPHLNSASSSSSTRLNGQTTATRRSEGREPREPGKRRAGEASDDWRRGDTARGRDDRSENTRGERDDKERPRSRVRNASRPRRDPSASRGGREREDRDTDRDRDRRRGDRDEHRREKEDHPRRARDADRDEDDGRHWRDDGRREERVAARRGGDRDWERDRDRDRWDRNGDKPSRDEGASDRTRDKDRWATEDRDARPKRSSGRERKTGSAVDSGKDKDDGKEKEPAWMETYVPAGTSGGILGGKGTDGELDELQAWKKTMKEREQKGTASANGGSATKNESVRAEKEAPTPPVPATEGNLDEIQQFKLIMKRAQEEKQDGTPTSSQKLPIALETQGPPPGLKKDPFVGLSTNATAASPMSVFSEGISASSSHPSAIASPSESAPAHANTTDSLLALLGSSASRDNSAPTSVIAPGNPSSGIEDGKPAVSRMFPNVGLGESRPAPDAGSASFNPPSGSRVLSMGGRGASTHAKAQGLPMQFSSGPISQQSSQSTPTAYSPNPSTGRHTPLSQPMSQYQEPPQRFNAEELLMRERPGSQQAMMFNEPAHALPERLPERGGDLGLLSQYADNRRLATGSPVLQFPDVAGAGMEYAGGYAQAKGGSRFAKLWDSDGRGRPGHSVSPGLQGPVDLNAFPGMARHDPKQYGVEGLRESPLEDRVASQLQAIMNGPTQRSIPTHHANPGSFSVNYPAHHPLHQQQQLHQQNYSRQEYIHDQLLEDRGFVADGLVPGLRNTPLPRGRDPQAAYLGDQLGESLQYGGQRLPPQARGLEHILPGNLPLHAQVSRGAGLPVQQNQYGRGPSPITAGISVPGGQRMPTGLANLGSRPPHDPSQFMGAGIGGPSQGYAGQSPLYNNLGGGVAGAGANFGGGPQIRPGPHQLQNALAAQNGLGALGMQNNLDLRGNQAHQLLGLAGGLGMNGVRGGAGAGGGGGGFGPQQAHVPMGGRGLQPQQQHLPSPMSVGMMQPPHAQSPGGAQSAHHDALVALLMGRRE